VKLIKITIPKGAAGRSSLARASVRFCLPVLRPSERCESWSG
jgi:hypothetical protein